MGSCLSSNHISLISKETKLEPDQKTQIEPKPEPEPATFEDLVRECTAPELNFKHRLRLMLIVERDFRDRRAKFLYKCVLACNRDGYCYERQYFFNRLCAIGDCEFVLRIIQQFHHANWSVYNHLKNYPFYAHSNDIDIANHVLKVISGTKNKQLLERHIMYFATWPSVGIALREFFLLGEDVSRSLNYYFLHQRVGDFNKDILPLCRLLYSLGLPGNVLSDIVSRGVGVKISAEYGVAMSCPPWDVVQSVIAWKVFGGGHVHLAELILDMTGSVSTHWSNWAKATSGSVHFTSSGSRFGRDSVVYTVYSSSGKPEIRIAH